MGVADLIIGPAATLITDVIDRIFPDKDAQATQRAQLMLQAQQIDAQIAQAQIAANADEAKNENLFVSGWRPFIGWVCGISFAYHLIFQPLISFVLASRGISFPLPVFDSAQLSDVLMGMLGLGAMRTTEKLGSAGNLPWQK